MATTALTGNVGETLFVKALQTDAYGGSSNSAVTWSTSSAAVATVQNVAGSNNAVIRCWTNGAATITATMGAVTATFTVTVITPTAYDGYSLVVEADQSFVPPNKTIQTKP